MLTLLLSLSFQAPQLPQKQLVQDLRIAAAAVGDEFTDASSVAEVGGKIFIADLRVPTIFRFDPRGKPDGKVGRSGQGPGEYRFPDRLGLAGDTLWVGDGSQRRVVLFAADGRSLRVISLPGATSGNVAYSAGGSSLALPSWSSSLGMPDAPTQLPVLRFGPDGRLRDTLLLVPAENAQRMVPTSNGMSIVGPQPFDDTPLVAASSSGDGFVLVERRTTGPATITVTRYGADGRRRWATPITYPPLPLESSVVDSVVQEVVHPGPSLPFTIAEADARKAIILPPRATPVLSVSVAPDGTVWLRRPNAVGHPARYTVLDKNGRPSYEIATPTGRIIGFGTGTVWIGSKDEDDLPIVTRYRIQ